MNGKIIIVNRTQNKRNKYNENQLARLYISVLITLAQAICVSLIILNNNIHIIFIKMSIYYYTIFRLIGKI